MRAVGRDGRVARGPTADTRLTHALWLSSDGSSACHSMPAAVLFLLSLWTRKLPLANCAAPWLLTRPRWLSEANLLENVAGPAHPLASALDTTMRFVSAHGSAFFTTPRLTWTGSTLA